ncbi:MAG: PAS domain S-box protein [Chloroflexota bacterium]
MDRALVRVLLVEDNPADALLLKESLVDDPLTEFHVTNAESLGQGLEQLAAGGYDAVLLDLGLPDSQGLETFTSARGKFPDIPIIVLSGMEDDRLALQAVQAGAQDYLLKSATGWKLGARAIRYALERHRADETLHKKEAELSSIFRAAPVGIGTTINRVLQEVNSTFCKMTGYAREELLGKPARILYVNDEDYEYVGREKYRQIAEYGVGSVETRFKCKDGGIIDVFLCSTLLDQSDPARGYTFTALDITERKRAEEEMKQSQAFSKTIIDSIPGTFYMIDASGRYVGWNAYQRDEIVGQPESRMGEAYAIDTIHPDDRPAIGEKIANVLKNGTEEVVEGRVLLRGGPDFRWLLMTGTRMMMKDRPVLVGIGIDITERKQADQALRESQAELKAVYEHAPVMMCLLGPGRQVLYANQAFTDFTGIPEAELKQGRACGVFGCINASEHPQGCGFGASCRDCRLRLAIEDTLATGQGHRDVEYSATLERDGLRRDVDLLGATARIESGKSPRVLLCLLDITERKRAEMELQYSKDRLLEAQRLAHIGNWEWDLKKQTLFWSDEVFRIFGVSPSEFAPSQHTFESTIHPDDVDDFLRQRERMLAEKKSACIDHRIVLPDGQIRHVQERTQLILDDTGNVARVIGTVQDITERKLAEERIARTERHFQALIEKAPDGVVLIGADLNFAYISPSARKIFGYGIDDPIDITPNGSTYPEDLPRVLEVLNRLIQDPSQSPMLQYRFRHKDGSWLWIESTFTNLLADPSVEAIVINFRDVTGRLEAERKIQESEERSQRAHDAADLGTWQDDLIQHVFSLDERARRHFDLDAPTLLDTELASRLHPQDRPRVGAAIESAAAANQDRIQLEYRVVHRDGSVHWLSVHGRMYSEERNGVWMPVLAAGTSQDITERKIVEEELARRNRQMRLIHEATQRLNMALDPAYVYQVIYASIRELLPCNTLLISVFDPGRELISLAAGWHDGQPVDAAAFEPIPLEPEGSGVQSRAIRTKNPEWIPDYQARLKNVQVAHHFDGEGHFVDEAPQEGDIPRSALVVPLLIEGQARGVIQVFSYQPNAYTEDDLQILAGFGAQAAIALSNARLYDNLRQENLERQRAEQALLERTRQLEALFAIADRLGDAQSEEQALDTTLEYISSLMDAPAGGIALLEPGRDHFKLTRAVGIFAANLGRTFPLTAGLTGQVLRLGRPVVTADYAAEPLRFQNLVNVDELGPGLFVPICTESQFSGVLIVLRLKGQVERPFSQEDIHLLSAVGEILGSALQRVRLFAQTTSQLNQLQTLYKMDRAITGSLDLGLTLRLLLAEIVDQPEVDAADILLVNPHSLTLEYAASSGFRAHTVEQVRLLIGQGYAGQAALNRRIFQARDLQNCDEPLQRQVFVEEGFKAYTAAPLIAKGKIVGVLELYSHSVSPHKPEWDDFVETLAGQATIAIEDVRLFTDLQRSNLEMELAFDAIIEGWARTVELHANESVGHSTRMAAMTLDLARLLGMQNEDMLHLRRGALLHDIGKLSIPDEILLKPGPLSPAEWEIVRRHPLTAFEILQPIEYLRKAQEVPYCHHEKWDGTGYPRGLSGEQIPLAARIFAVVDVYESLTSARSYRPAWEGGKAQAYIQEQSGLHFDPQVVQVFQSWFRMR